MRCAVRHTLAWLTSMWFLCWSSPAQADSTLLTTVAAATGIKRPIFARSPDGDYERLFIGEQWTGLVKILKNGVLLPDPYLDLGPLISVGDDQGLRSFAFHPDFAKNGYFFVTYIDLNGDLVLARFQTSSDPDAADPLSEEILLVIDEPWINHSGGMIAFGPNDGYLYVATGDGGPGLDPNNRAQDPGQLLGKMLRLDVDGRFPYGIPADNPYVGPGDPLDEIWAMGLRHPWRFSFDRLTGDMFIADVGQSSREELDYQPGTSSGGENYGWRCMEGIACTGLTGCTCDDPALTLPIYDYDHSIGCAIIGGYVYRGCAVPDLQGSYFFSDYCNERIIAIRHDGSTITEFLDRTEELDPDGDARIRTPFSFGEDAWGEIYILDGADSTVWKIVPREPVARSLNYGVGWAGTNGIPALRSRQLPVPCSRIQIEIENSRGAATLSYVFAGMTETLLPTPWDGTLLVQAMLVRPFLLPAARFALLPLDIPCDASFCHVVGFLQVLEMDPAASKGVSFTPGLKLVIGDV
ncbi:MAG: PQQ-dependent sugar dehydrogenase [Planctomycetota bacterium]